MKDEQEVFGQKANKRGYDKVGEGVKKEKRQQ